MPQYRVIETCYIDSILRKPGEKHAVVELPAFKKDECPAYLEPVKVAKAAKAKD
jgi:hypothetical protein